MWANQKKLTKILSFNCYAMISVHVYVCLGHTILWKMGYLWKLNPFALFERWAKDWWNETVNNASWANDDDTAVPKLIYNGDVVVNAQV